MDLDKILNSYQSFVSQKKPEDCNGAKEMVRVRFLVSPGNHKG